MKIYKVKIGELKPTEYNPRKWDKKAISDLTESIKKFGIVDPIIANSAVSRKNIVIGGHFRLKVAKDLKYKSVPVVYIEIPDIKKEKELNLRLNKNLGDWDFDLLAQIEKEILLDVGFGSEEIDRIFSTETSEDDFDTEKEYEKIKKPKTKEGYSYELGEHRLICGDSSKPEDMKKLVKGKKAEMVFTDPPYNVDYRSPGGLSYNSKKFGGSGGKIFNDDKSDAECLKFYTEVLKNIYDFTVDSATIYWWFANRNNWINRAAFNNSGWHMSQIVIWLKNSFVFSRGQDYHRCYEPCMMGWKNKKTHYKNKEITNLKDVFNLDFSDFNEMLDVWYEKRDNTLKYEHPTQKPVRLAERALKKNSRNGGIILDVFGGSGSTMIACEQLGRKCYMMELDPKFCDVIVKRWESFTGRKTKLI